MSRWLLLKLTARLMLLYYRFTNNLKSVIDIAKSVNLMKLSALLVERIFTENWFLLSVFVN